MKVSKLADPACGEVLTNEDVYHIMTEALTLDSRPERRSCAAGASSRNAHAHAPGR